MVRNAAEGGQRGVSVLRVVIADADVVDAACIQRVTNDVSWNPINGGRRRLRFLPLSLLARFAVVLGGGKQHVVWRERDNTEKDSTEIGGIAMVRIKRILQEIEFFNIGRLLREHVVCCRPIQATVHDIEDVGIVGRADDDEGIEHQEQRQQESDTASTTCGSDWSYFGRPSELTAGVFDVEVEAHGR